MEAGRRRGDRPGLASEDRLVGLAVFRQIRGARLPPDVGRQRHAADLFQEGVVHVAIEGDLPASVLADGFHAGAEAAREADRRKPFGSAARFREREPPARVPAQGMEKEDLDESVLGISTPEPRAADPHIVAHEEVPFAEELGEVREPPVRHGSRFSIQDHQAARPARSGRLRDPAGRKGVVEEVNPHVESSVVLSEAKNPLSGSSPFRS